MYCQAIKPYFISLADISYLMQEPSGNHTPPQLSPSLSQSTYTTGGSLDIPHIIMQGDARRRRNDSYFDDIPRSKLERQMAQVKLENSMFIRNVFLNICFLALSFRNWCLIFFQLNLPLSFYLFNSFHKSTLFLVLYGIL